MRQAPTVSQLQHRAYAANYREQGDVDWIRRPRLIKANKRRRQKPAEAGFSLLELTVVVALLGILTAITIPNITKWIFLSKIDAVKTILNSAASECLQEVREGKDPNEVSPAESTASNDILSSYGYQIKQAESKCGSFFAIPVKEGETFLYPLGFRINANGEIVKVAIPASDSGSLNSCKNWAGVNCGVSPEQQAIWDALAKIEKDKKTCNDNFYTWLQKPSSGSYNRWDEATKSCSLETWAFEGSIQKDESAVKSARAAKIGAACVVKLQTKESEKFDGLFNDAECGKTYFCSGKDLATDDIVQYESCKEEERITRCTAALGRWKDSSANGQFSEPGCTTLWKCNNIYYTDQASFEASTCGCTWQKETYISGTKTVQVQTGTKTEVVNPCERKVGNTCIPKTIQTPIISTREEPVYATRDVCKK